MDAKWDKLGDGQVMTYLDLIPRSERVGQTGVALCRYPGDWGDWLDFPLPPLAPDA